MAPTDTRGRARKARNRRRRKGRPRPSRIPADIREVIEIERSRLLRAYSVLGCLELAIDYSHGMEDVQLSWSDVAAVARELVDVAIDRLDSVSLEPPGERHRSVE